MATNAELAGRAHEIAITAPAGSMQRRAYGCASVALGTTGTLASARKVLGVVWPPEVQTAAREALEALTAAVGEVAA